MADHLAHVTDLSLQLLLVIQRLLDLSLQQLLVLVPFLLGLSSSRVQLLNLVEFFLPALHIAALPFDHLLQVLQQVVQASQVLLVFRLVLGAQLQNNLEPLLLQQTLTELRDGAFLLVAQVHQWSQTPITHEIFVAHCLRLLDLELAIEGSEFVVFVDDLVDNLFFFFDVAFDVVQFIVCVRLNFVFEFGQLLIAGHALKEAVDFEGLASIDELHIFYAVFGAHLFLELFYLVILALLRLQLLSEAAESYRHAHGLDLGEACAVLHRAVVQWLQHRRNCLSGLLCG